MACAQRDVPDEATIVSEVDAIVDAHAGQDGAVIPVLQSIQERLGYVPREAIKRVGERMSISYSELAGVVSFYSYFTTVPRGRHTVRVCLGTACYVRGGKEVLQKFEESLGIEVGNTTEDRLFSLEVGRCFGACGLAPVVLVDDEVHQRVSPPKVRGLLDAYRDAADAESSAEAAGTGGGSESAGGRAGGADEPKEGSA